LGLFAATAPAAAASSNLLTDGSFEQPSVAGPFAYFVSGETFGGWTVVGKEGDVAVVGSGFIDHDRGKVFRFTAKAGVQLLDLTGNYGTGQGIFQTVKTRRGTKYTLRFSVGNVVDPKGLFGTSSTVVVRVNGRRVMTATNSGGGTTQNWKTFTRKIRATSAKTKVEFRNGDPRSDHSNCLDAVSLTLG
jgi:hypothetical protein